jgi:SAM-dependent methyltransferase
VTNPSDIYTAEWYRQEYEDGLQWPSAQAAARALAALFEPHRVLDVGCGPGFMVAALRELGVEAFGFDGSTHAIAHASNGAAKPFVWQQDIREPVGYPDKIDLVLCTEVAEHMAPEHADRLVAVLCGPGAPWVVFTAAAPGQGGLDHVNEQPKPYWMEKFSALGYEPDFDTTLSLFAAWAPIIRLSHLSKNVIVFSKGSA